jgi:hypothetical protein
VCLFRLSQTRTRHTTLGWSSSSSYLTHYAHSASRRLWRDPHSPPTAQRLKEHEQLCHSLSLVLVVYATAKLLRAEADNMVPRFANYWNQRTGHNAARVLFDSPTTTYAGLSQLTRRKIGFITICRIGSSMMTRVGQLPADR